MIPVIVSRVDRGDGTSLVTIGRNDLGHVTVTMPTALIGTPDGDQMMMTAASMTDGRYDTPRWRKL